MAFTVRDFEDLTRLIAEHPEWRQRLRALILGDGLLALPASVSATSQRLDAVESALDRVVEEISRLTDQISELVRVSEMSTRRLNRIDGRMRNVEGQLLELRYDRNPIRPAGAA